MDNTTHHAYNWAMANLTEWIDKQKNLDHKDFAVARLDTYMKDLIGTDFLAYWDYFDVYGYIVDGLDNRLIIRDDETGQFSVVNQNTLPCSCTNENDWLIEHHGKGHTVFVILAS
jgi:hypothetical protein